MFFKVSLTSLRISPAIRFTKASPMKVEAAHRGTGDTSRFLKQLQRNTFIADIIDICDLLLKRTLWQFYVKTFPCIFTETVGVEFGCNVWTLFSGPVTVAPR